jgi:hypothetical protein
VTSSSIVFVRRQSPDWQSLSQDWRRGAHIDPVRYVPDHSIPYFPDRVDLLIQQWNRRFKIDFFTFRYVVAELSHRSIASIRGARLFTFDQLQAVADHARTENIYVYFHDDDDFFSPSLPLVIQSAKTQPDAIVTPMFRFGADGNCTFAREECTPEFLWGRRQPHHFRYQTNNYGLSGRRCTTLPELSALKDHVLASSYADQENYRDEVLPSIISATVKSPGSASALPVFRGGADSHKQYFDRFIERLDIADLPDAYGWMSQPMQMIARLVESVYRGAGYDAIDHLLPQGSPS